MGFVEQKGMDHVRAERRRRLLCAWGWTINKKKSREKRIRDSSRAVVILISQDGNFNINHGNLSFLSGIHDDDRRCSHSQSSS